MVVGKLFAGKTGSISPVEPYAQREKAFLALVSPIKKPSPTFFGLGFFSLF
jgi:hypothetical protein